MQLKVTKPGRVLRLSPRIPHIEELKAVLPQELYMDVFVEGLSTHG
jgi:hypothetical protein